jgi:hypothetical protein
MSETTGLNIEAPTNWLDDRLGIARSSRKLINKIFPDHCLLVGTLLSQRITS